MAGGFRAQLRGPYGLGVKTRSTKTDDAAIPFFQQAIEKDPNFALAHVNVVAERAVVTNVGERERRGCKEGQQNRAQAIFRKRIREVLFQRSKIVTLSVLARWRRIASAMLMGSLCVRTRKYVPGWASVRVSWSVVKPWVNRTLSNGSTSRQEALEIPETASKKNGVFGVATVNL